MLNRRKLLRRNRTVLTASGAGPELRNEAKLAMEIGAQAGRVLRNEAKPGRSRAAPITRHPRFGTIRGGPGGARRSGEQTAHVELDKSPISHVRGREFTDSG